ncbi:hypothetical protein BCR39DRAFT_590346 [Naematelia encephala]|uniref:Uncharacterized protein n=1 Tax=Naematelia encephala TaxID=71784 RepID=A0A1Y2ARI3_9TREE|nr:hypothetical protein BCR39DRAFT_590346 [Naematelia encephala]
MSYSIATSGRTRHLNMLHIDLDCRSPTYRTAATLPIQPHEYDPRMVAIGTWRLPQSLFGAGEMLWRLWDVAAPDERDEPGFLRDLTKRTEITIQDRVNEAGVIEKFINLGQERKDIMDSETERRLRHETFCSAQTWIYLRGKEIVMRQLHVVYLAEDFLLREPYSGLSSSNRPSTLLWRNKKDAKLDYLNEQVSLAQSTRSQAERYLSEGDYYQAAQKALIGLAILAPWYPLELYMPQWEADLTGLLPVVVDLNCILAQSMSSLKDHLTVISISRTFQHHPFLNAGQRNAFMQMEFRALMTNLRALEMDEDPSRRLENAASIWIKRDRMGRLLRFTNWVAAFIKASALVSEGADFEPEQILDAEKRFRETLG